MVGTQNVWSSAGKSFCRPAIWIGILAITISFSAPDIAVGAKISGKVVKVPNGGVLVVLSKGRRVRVTLDGIDVPRGSAAFASDAKLVLDRLAKGARVRVQFDGKRTDKKVRGTVFLPGKKKKDSLNRSLVLAGLARATSGGALAKAQRRAERDELGLFGDQLGRSITVPSTWKLTGSANTIPFDAGLNITQRVDVLRALSTAYAEIDRLTRGRELFVSNPTLGLGGATEIERFTALELCASGSFRRVFREFGGGFAINDSEEGTWEVVLDLTTLEGVTPILVLSTTSGTDGTGQPIAPRTQRFTLEPDTNSAGRVLIGDLSFASGPAVDCPP